MKRRNFIASTALGATGIACNPKLLAQPLKPYKNIPFLVGTMVMAEDLYEKGIAAELDRMQALGAINTVMPFSHNHVARQYKPNYAPKTDKEGRTITDIYVKTNPKYYKNPEWGYRDPKDLYANRDILDELGEACAERNMKVYARILEPYVITGLIPGLEDYAEVDSTGEKGRNVCYNHPGYIDYWKGVIDDLIISHPNLHGFKFGQERGGPFFEALKNNAVTCFCTHCVEKAKNRGVDAQRARVGFNAFKDFSKKAKEGEAPIDGFFATFLRILSEYPETLAYERFSKASREDQRKRMYAQIKKLNPAVQVGWHVDHSMGWSLGMRSFWPYDDMVGHSDWLSIALYFGSMGRRSYGHFKSNYQNLLFADADKETAYKMYLSINGMDPEQQPSLAEQENGGTEMHAEYVYKEAKRAVDNINGRAKVYGRIGFDHPGYNTDIQPEQVYEGTQEMFRAGVDGVFCGREWEELQEKNIVAFGNAVRDHVKNNR